MIIDLILTSLHFLPGVLLLYIISNKIKLQLLFLETILFGSLVWNYFFIASSVLVGLFTGFAVEFFKIFNMLSSLVATIAFIILIKRKGVKIDGIKSRIHQLPVIYGIGFVCLLLFSILAIYFHTLFVEWDLVYCYIPSAKAILLSGGISSQPYRLLNFFDVSPAIPILYASIIEFSSLESLYTLPIALFVLTLVTIWLISHELFSKNLVLVSTMIFMAFPTVTATISSRALYLDVSFLLYLLVTLYTTIKMVNMKSKEKTFSLQFVMFAVAFTLMFLTRSDLGLLLAPTIVAALVFALKVDNWRSIAVLFIGLPYYIREARNIYLDSASWISYAQRIVPVILISAIAFGFFGILKHRSKKPAKMILDKRLILLSLILISPVILYFARNVIISGFILLRLPLWNSVLTNACGFFRGIRPSPMRDLHVLLQWHNLFSVWWFITPYIIPFSIAVISIVRTITKKREIKLKTIPLYLFFSGFFILWSQLGCDPQPRRLYPFAVFATLTITYGLYKIRKFYNFRAFELRVFSYVMTITSVIWIKNNVRTVNDLALLYGSLYQPKMDMVLLAISTTLFLTIFAPYELLIARIRQRITSSKRITITVTTSILFLNLGLFSILVVPMTMDVADNGLGSRYEHHSGWYYYPDVVNYYNENITDNYTTIGFYCNELITFADRTIIDLYLSIYGSPIYSIIEKANSTQILEVFEELNVGYFLKPKPKNPFYSTYEKLVNSTVLGNVFLDNPQFRALATFNHATLYEFHEKYAIESLTYSDIKPWNYNPETNHTLDVKPNCTRFCSTTSSAGRISVMYTLEHPLTLDDALWIAIKSHSNSELVAILFSDLQNRTTDFLAFRCQLDNETRKPVLHINEGVMTGDFNPNHVEGILIGIETEPNREEAFEISDIYLITYP